MASKLSLSDIKDLINLTFCCQQATVITDFSKLEQAGKDHALAINGGSMPLEEFRKVDDLRQDVLSDFSTVLRLCHIYSPERLHPARYQVEKVVEVDVPEFDAFLGTPREAWPFLEENAELMHQWMGVDHCLLALAAGRSDGALVNSEGSGRAQYAAYLPQARAMVTAELDRAADLIVQRCAANTGAGSWQARFNNRPACGSCCVPLEELEEQLGLIIREGNGLDALRWQCAQEVKKANGSITFKDTLKKHESE